MAQPHIVIIHRWRDNYAEYAKYLDHNSYAVTYISTKVGLSSIPDDATAVSVVERTDDLREVRSTIQSHIASCGPPVGVVALKEDDLLTAARLREELGCPGPRHADLLLFRDKYLMCEAARRAGLATPPCEPVEGPGGVRLFGDAHGWPVVVKPRVSSSSEGVVIVGSPQQAGDIDFFDGRPRLVQAFDNRPIFHVDGVFTGSKLGPWKASRYLNNCLDFRGGLMLGSVEQDDPETVTTIGKFAARLLETLAAGPSVFHLEVFFADGECALLETAARVGGAEIPFLWREVHGFDLMRAACDIQLGRDPRTDGGVGSDEVAGWLLAPAPIERPCLITEVTSMTGSGAAPYAEVIPSVGDVLPTADSYYEHVGGRFRFRGTTAKEVEASVTETARAFRVRGRPM
ncbi:MULTISPECIES: ATP-grasp domain-containing protein [Streptomyces]|uniref:ATP-grasp domain-containing protein n=1 Tax=Streptomyces TaxID=1883 RepID=UPI00163D208B|nr:MULTISPECIES: biotin carboxylase [Streptomyces]MBC2876159.1 biotin carboxylase [Streptomyces sp. TYQ1024]UBI35608.1 biotin carboxylase [Streptomyces mobaraensis]UKW28203.1 biotin carboxylase [Streptomyces sp. TYQ1024]